VAQSHNAKLVMLAISFHETFLVNLSDLNENF